MCKVPDHRQQGSSLSLFNRMHLCQFAAFAPSRVVEDMHSDSSQSCSHEALMIRMLICLTFAVVDAVLVLSQRGSVVRTQCGVFNFD